MSIRKYKDPTDQSGRAVLYEVYVAVRNPYTKKTTQMRRRGIKTLPAAKNLEFELKRSLTNLRETKWYTWAEWHKQCVDRMKLEMRPSTIENYEGRLVKWTFPHWENRQVKDITPGDVHELLFTHIKETSDHSRKTIHKMVKRLFQMAVEENVIEKNPARKIKVRVAEAKQLVLNATEVNKLLQEAKATGHRYYEVWAVALFTGMRSGELYALKWTDIDFDSNRISVSRSWCSKAGFGPSKCARNRGVPIAKELRTLLLEMKMRRNPENEFVLKHHREWTLGFQAAVLKDFCLSIGITPIKFHDMRATFITQLLVKGVPLAQVMSMVGHSQLKTTNVYLRVAGADLNGATDALSFSLPPERMAEVITFKAKS